MSLPPIRPMLAAPSTKAGSRQAVDLATLDLSGAYTFDLKLDGLRALLYFDGQTMRLINRSGVDITAKFPDLAGIADALVTEVILDGEIVCDSGLFNDVATRGKQEKPAAITEAAKRLPARFVAFDLLHLGGADLRGLPYTRRRDALEAVTTCAGQPLLQASMTSTDGIAMWRAVGELGLEGIIAKLNSAPYYEGKRSPAWLKFKTTRRVTCIAVGYEPGTGARAHFGALFLAMVGPNGPVPVGKVGTGFKAPDIADLLARLTGPGAVPFPVEIEALNVGSGGQLRFPVYKGLRTDLALADCTLDQLDSLPRC